MPKPTKPLSDKQLEKYYKLWKKGLTQKQISDKTYIPKERLTKQAPQIVQYCKNRMAEKVKENLASGNGAEIIPLTPELRENYLSYLHQGLSVNQAADMIGVPPVTVMEGWYKQSSSFHDEARRATAAADVDVLLALRKRALGFDYIQTTKSETYNNKPLTDGDKEDKRDSKGKAKVEEMFFSNTTTTNKKVLPSIDAAKFWLINRQPSHWSINGAEGSEEATDIPIRSHIPKKEIKTDE